MKGVKGHTFSIIGCPPPLGWFESNEGVLQKLGRLSRHSNPHLLTWILRDLRGFARIRSRGDVRGRSRADAGFGCVTAHRYVRMGWGEKGKSKRVVARRLGWPWAHESKV
eukprot:4662492-Prymnesium_polylepis.1